MSWLKGFEHFVTTDELLAPHCWLRLGGPAQYFARPTTQDELVQIVARCHDADVPLRLLGGGSNLLVRDAGVSGVTLRLDAPDFCQIQVTGHRLQCGGGASLAHVISCAIREGLAGLEPLMGIPGTVGGALHANAGDRATSVGEWLQQAVVLTRSGEPLTRRRDEMSFAYRSSSLNELAILQAEFLLEPEPRAELTRRMQKLWIVKRAQQPGGDLPAGYLFKDPLGMTAAEAIEQAGLKGLSRGGASLFDRDPNFVVIRQKATSDDVLRLLDDVRRQVATTLGVDLEAAIEIW